ncbi:oligosaccharide flippase family protein [Arenibacter sp. 6A1]|uniref:oligosaccharide flippase family protein n=1 Tax=Arenibacter sp. 6A1 TaxID=2720391 RepID=UPI0014477C7D|nr:oligosaccharide flippase family protein [Arenibacter sp. 6A1]NKI25223.1 oligosaccharide flippase family protein [Arenibacter sp. 6A1]
MKKLKNLFKGKDAKVLLQNFLSLSALQLVGMILPLITLPYVLRVLGFENYGIIVFAASLITYFSAFTDFSFKYTATRDVAVFRDSPKKINIIYSKVIAIKTIFLLLSFLIITVIVYSYEPFYQNRLIYFLTMPMLLGQALFPDWFFQGIEKMKYITFLNIGIKLFFTLCLFLFIKEKSDYWIYPLLQSAGFICAGIVGQFILVRKYNLRLIWLRPVMIKNTILSNTPIFINQFIPTLYNNTSTFLLGILTNNTLVGIYEAIKTIVNLCVTIIEILSRVFFPFLNRKKQAFAKYKKMMLRVSIFITLGCLLSYKLVFWYLNIYHINAFFVLAILTFGLIGYTLYNIFGINYFIIKRQDKLVMNNTIKASIISFILAIPLICYFGIIGAAINLTLARWMMGAGLLYKYRKELNKNNS